MRMKTGGSGEFAFSMAGYDVIALPDDPQLERFSDPLEWPDPLPTATIRPSHHGRLPSTG